MMCEVFQHPYYPFTSNWTAAVWLVIMNLVSKAHC